LDIAEPGENEVPTKLYSPLHTPMSQLGDFGLGYSLDFSTLRATSVRSVILACRIDQHPQYHVQYFQGEEYSQGQEGVSSMLQGSAICTGVYEMNNNSVFWKNGNCRGGRKIAQCHSLTTTLPLAQ
jgi:hypothetical protein